MVFWIVLWITSEDIAFPLADDVKRVTYEKLPQGQDTAIHNFYFLKYLSTSRAAIHPLPAAVTACL